MIVALVGPTGVGKSELARDLACRMCGVVLSADALQVYRELNIGTAKLPLAERRVRHFGLDLVSLDQSWSAARYQRYARGVIEDCQAKDQPVIVCGGTGLYVRAALDEFDFASGGQTGNTLRKRYEALLADQGAAALYALLEERDPVSAERVHPHNTRRVIRALELCDRGESYAQRSAGFKDFRSHYPGVRYLGLSKERATLYRDLDARVEGMLAAGLLDEVCALRAAGLAKTPTARQAIGYKELLTYLEGGSSYEEAVAAIKQNTRRYAKRQMTFFSADPRISWIDGGTYPLLDAAWSILEK
ncbi:MAG: tRNA (adenosine(37)-N6)-dimethylallyltransferase MiaA [Actinomycetia bacterium]|nr:tRNA (adenosine(37)-N6)-dimethylallyltransferase MiaA [Actinomycetes bacterium]